MKYPNTTQTEDLSHEVFDALPRVYQVALSLRPYLTMEEICNLDRMDVFMVKDARSGLGKVSTRVAGLLWDLPTDVYDALLKFASRFERAENRDPMIHGLVFFVGASDRMTEEHIGRAIAEATAAASVPEPEP